MSVAFSKLSYIFKSDTIRRIKMSLKQNETEVLIFPVESRLKELKKSSKVFFKELFKALTKDEIEEVKDSVFYTPDSDVLHVAEQLIERCTQRIKTYDEQVIRYKKWLIQDHALYKTGTYSQSLYEANSSNNKAHIEEFTKLRDKTVLIINGLAVHRLTPFKEICPDKIETKIRKVNKI